MEEIRSAGFNSVRIPFGFWIVEGIEQYGVERGPLVGPVRGMFSQKVFLLYFVLVIFFRHVFEKIHSVEIECSLCFIKVHNTRSAIACPSTVLLRTYALHPGLLVQTCGYGARSLFAYTLSLLWY